MAKYDVTYRCGHTGVVNLTGKIKDREWKLDREAMKLCPDCWKVEQGRLHAEENARSAEKCKEEGLPELMGTQKQIAWANTIRLNLINQIEKTIANLLERAKEKEEFKKNATIALKSIKRKTSASWWIDHRNVSDFDIINLIKREFREAKKALTEAPAEVVEKINNEATVYPENQKTSTVAEIRPLEGRLEINFPESRDDFRKIVKNELKMTWNDTCWSRRILSKHGKVQDRAAEAGHKLLAAGFPIRIFNEEIRQKAITGEYEIEITNWIQVRAEGEYKDWFAISWDREDDYYKVARQIPGSRWSKPSVVVPPIKYEEVLDFAKMYNFKLSEKAQELAEIERKKKEAALVVSVKLPEKKERVVAPSIPPILEIPTEVTIDDDLKD